VSVQPSTRGVEHQVRATASAEIAVRGESATISAPDGLEELFVAHGSVRRLVGAHFPRVTGRLGVAHAKELAARSVANLEGWRQSGLERSDLATIQLYVAGHVRGIAREEAHGICQDAVDKKGHGNLAENVE